MKRRDFINSISIAGVCLAIKPKSICDNSFENEIKRNSSKKFDVISTKKIWNLPVKLCIEIAKGHDIIKDDRIYLISGEYDETSIVPYIYHGKDKDIIYTNIPYRGISEGGIICRY